MRHLMRLKHKFTYDPRYKQKYVDFMEKMISHGYAEKIPNGQQEKGKAGHMENSTSWSTASKKEHYSLCIQMCT